MKTPILAPRPNWPVASTASKPHLVLTHSDSEWAAFYPEIERLYVRERRKLRYVIKYMESERGFKATEQMYKKRFAKWGFQKNSKRSATTPQPLKTNDKYKTVASRKASPPRELGSMQAFPGLCHQDGLTLLFLTSVRTSSVAFFESVQCRDAFLASRQQLSTGQLRPSNTQEICSAFKLVTDLLDRGRGDLAGRMARKAFVLLEEMLMLEGPALVWNLLEMMHYMVKLRHAQLFHILLRHLIALAGSQMAETHPLPTMLRGLRGLVKTMTSVDPGLHSSALPSLLERAWTLNAEILFNHFHPRLYQLYLRILWDSCSIGPPAAISFSHMEAQQMLSAATVAYQGEGFLASTPVEEDKMIQRLLTPRVDTSPPQDYKMLRASSIAALREHGDSILNRGPSFNGDTTILLGMLAGLATSKVLEGSPAVVESRLDAKKGICAIKALVDLKSEHGGHKLGAYLDAVERIRAIVALRGYAEGETDPQVVREMWLLQDALVAAGENGEAQEVEQDAYRRIEKYIQDIPIDSA
ncbi:hypothetical protein K505DRAFT_377733 [Melanomma pulvis-pyrius CBS 109.77]|uniref:Clr5 domain-containing protein n=1 Tax=Melanomma pulvis-pyrius CBS 109.77 TaxID=1314802 RepID=A0A6A6X1Q7_9PLEO|nr:hypothetical protein K505DRAFT_377733 [Melanomma pulvis-pyrius CBS 109.77]